MPDYYRILGVSKDAGSEEIRRAYRQLARQHHPDRSGAESADRFREIRHAYETLSDEDRRRTYDAGRAAGYRMAAGRADRDNWFADEVAIDFPSVDGILCRMREAFFGAADVTSLWCAEIPLTAHDAFQGARVPLEVPVRHTCPICGGRGEVWMEVCDLCAGTGDGVFRYHIQLLVPPGVRHGTRLRVNVTPPYAPATLVEVRIAIQ